MVSPSKLNLDRTHSTAITFRVGCAVAVLAAVAAFFGFGGEAPAQGPQISFRDVYAESQIR